MKLSMNVVLYKIFQKYQNSILGHATFLLTSSCFKIVIQIVHFYE